MKLDSKIWDLLFKKVYGYRRETLEKIYGSLSLEPPYSASVTTVLRCYTRVNYDASLGRFDAVPKSSSVLIGLVFDFSCRVLLEGYPPPEHHYVKTFRDSEGNEYAIHAGPDAIVDGEGVELKFTLAPLENLPMEHHELQVKIYMNILETPGRLVYLTPRGVREFYYGESEALSDLEVAEVARSFFIDKRSPRYEWECEYCDYRAVCPLARERRADSEVPHKQ